jgi:hypothetical protein
MMRKKGFKWGSNKKITKLVIVPIENQIVPDLPPRPSTTTDPAFTPDLRT